MRAKSVTHIACLSIKLARLFGPGPPRRRFADRCQQPAPLQLHTPSHTRTLHCALKDGRPKHLGMYLSLHQAGLSRRSALARAPTTNKQMSPCAPAPISPIHSAHTRHCTHAAHILRFRICMRHQICAPINLVDAGSYCDQIATALRPPAACARGTFGDSVAPFHLIACLPPPPRVS